MKRLLHIDSSARRGYSDTDRHGSHTRRLSRRFVARWCAARPDDLVIRRDVAATPPTAVDLDWIDASFTPADRRTPEQAARLRESDELVAELVAADVLVIGAPMYNFGLPSPLKAWIDNVVRVGVTFGFDRARAPEPYWPMLTSAKPVVILSARGDYGYEAGGRLAARNLVESGLTVPLGYLGLTEAHGIAVEYDEFGDERLAASLAAAEMAVDQLADALISAPPAAA
ncbi:FMN-dependent NADH-azoreductase [Sphingomonas sp. DT-51]|uniref:FMN-dependent NADH-azoreductase n=1 Tax=Sphingomonas sp. DT-51 TaxID=3396165 RepID=UPI003F1BEE2F